MSQLLPFLGAITPEQFINSRDYQGVEYRWKFFTYRPAVIEEVLRADSLLIGGIVFYILFSVWGKFHNSKKANAWINAHLPIYEQQFSKPTNGGLTQDGSSDFFNFSTGRRHLTSLHTTLTLRPRQDFLQWFFQTSRALVDLTYRPRDEIELDFKLVPGSGVPDFVWAVVSKDELLDIKDYRWDLTFTRTTENIKLPPHLSVMSEFVDVTDCLLQPQLISLLSDPAIAPYFRSLSVTDQPRERPTELGAVSSSTREKHLILSLTAPSTSDVEVTSKLVAGIFTFLDMLPRTLLRPETKVKVKRAREDVDKQNKEESEKDKKEGELQALEDKKAAKRRAEEERVSRLSAAEQKKITEKERKRSYRKQQGKVSSKAK